MGKLSRTKGKVFEREVASMFREAFPEHAHQIKRGWQARSGADDPDVIVPELPLWIECKHGIKPNPRAALEQAEKSTKIGLTPLAIIKDNGRKPFVVIRAIDFIDILKEWWHLRNS